MSPRNLLFVCAILLTLTIVRSYGSPLPSATSSPSEQPHAVGQMLGPSVSPATTIRSAATSPSATIASPAKSPTGRIELPRQTPRSSSLATSSVTPPDPLASEIEAGKIFLSKNHFDEASAAFLRALKSTNAETRHAALAGLQQLEEKRYGPSRWFFSLAGAWVPSAITVASALLFLLLLWLALGPVGRFFGRNRIKVSGFAGAETDGAALFKVALAAAITEHTEPLGPLAAQPATPWIILSTSEILDVIPEVSQIPAGKIVAALLKRTVIPEHDVRVSTSGENNEILAVALFRGNMVRRVWREQAREKDDFLANLRAARKMIAYLIEVQ
jgi:hypothetical protein